MNSMYALSASSPWEEVQGQRQSSDFQGKPAAEDCHLDVEIA